MALISFEGEAVNADSYLSQPSYYLLFCIYFLMLPPLYLLCFNIVAYAFLKVNPFQMYLVALCLTFASGLNRFEIDLRCHKSKKDEHTV